VVAGVVDTSWVDMALALALALALCALPAMYR
jgi:hypothetical protein